MVKPSSLPQKKFNPVRAHLLGELLLSSPARRAVKVFLDQKDKDPVEVPGPEVAALPRLPLAANVQLRNVDIIARRWA